MSRWKPDKWKKLNRCEFDKWILAYPKKLEVSVMNFFDPPLVGYFDFSLGKKGVQACVAAYCAEVKGVSEEKEWQVLIRGTEK